MAFDPQMGTGGGNMLTAINEAEGIATIMRNIAADLDEANTEGALGVTLRVTADRLGADYGWGGRGVIPSGSSEHLRALLNDIADDIEDIRVAGADFTRVHTKAKIPVDFLEAGKHMHRSAAQDDGGVPVPGVGPDGYYDWVLQPLNAIGFDIESIKTENSLVFVPRTVPIPIPP